MERVRPSGPATLQSEQSPEPRMLWDLLQKPPDEVVATRINSVLIAMRLPGNEKLEAVVILRALEEKRFHGRVDAQGRDCRKEAVETLLACGFPHALNVTPEDLEYARNWRRAARQPLLEEEDDGPRASKGITRLVMWLMVAATVAQSIGIVGIVSSPMLGLASAVAASMFGGAAWLTRLESSGDTLFGAIVLALFAGAISVMCALSGGPTFVGGALVCGAALVLLTAACGAADDRNR